MFKSTAKADQFYERSGSESTKPSRKGFSLLGGGEDVLSHLAPAERQESLRQGLIRKSVLLQARIEKEALTLDERREIGLEIAELNKKIAIWKPRKAKKGFFSNQFMDAARSVLTKQQFQLVLDETHRRFHAQDEGSDINGEGKSDGQDAD